METQSKTEGRRARILLVDDHPIVLSGLSQLINYETDMSVCGQVTNAEAALKTIEDLKPDLVIVDIALKGTNGLDLIKQAKAQQPQLLMLVLSMHNEALYAERALRAGATGYIMKEELTEKLVPAIRRVLNGEIYLSEKMSTQLLSRLVKGPLEKSSAAVECLSDRELEVFQLIGQGYSARQIADQLHLSVKTIESHRERIKAKLKLGNATELVQHAFHWVQGLGSR
jgi:DNA-binding NarL/FixJ family response regulator